MGKPSLLLINKTRYDTAQLKDILSKERRISNLNLIVEVTYFTPSRKVHCWNGVETPVLVKQSHYQEKPKAGKFFEGHHCIEVSLVKPTPANFQHCSLEDQMASLGDSPKAPRSMAAQILWSLTARLMEWEQHRLMGVCMPYPMNPWCSSGLIAQYEDYLNLPLHFGKKDPTKEHIEFQRDLAFAQAHVLYRASCVQASKDVIERRRTDIEEWKEAITAEEKKLERREKALVEAKEKMTRLITGNV